MSDVAMLGSYLAGKWTTGSGEGSPLVNPTTEVPLARASTAGLDLAEALSFARTRGGPALRELTFEQRGRLIGEVSSAIHDKREELIELAIANGGNTRGDAKFDIDGATATLSYYAKLGEKLGSARVLGDGDALQIGRSPRFVGQHIFTPRKGVAIHINAFNFPAWGMAEKAACALLAGMPILTKPATSTALVAERIAHIIADLKILPDGVFSFLCGSAGDLLDHVEWQDVIAFTGSSATGLAIRSHERVMKSGVRVNIEADSLNSAILGPDVAADSETFELFAREVVHEVTQKAGQKCTATRRVFVPEASIAFVRDALSEGFLATKTGDPSLKGVRVGPLATAQQLRDVSAGIDRLGAVATAVVGGKGRENLQGIDGAHGYFVPPTLFVAEDAGKANIAHEEEVFGPVTTVLPFKNELLAELVGLGHGSLVASVYSDDVDFIATTMHETAPYTGRLNIGSAKVAEHSMGPGTVLPSLIHGGPGRAGGGEELGAERGLALYSQHTALQGYGPLLEKLTAAKKS